jgi:hypothetical protein
MFGILMSPFLAFVPEKEANAKALIARILNMVAYVWQNRL